MMESSSVGRTVELETESVDGISNFDTNLESTGPFIHDDVTDR